MPTLDMSDVINSEEFCDEFYVIRRPEVINSKGRGVTSPQRLGPFTGIIVYKEDPNQRSEDAQMIWMRLVVITDGIQLRGASNGYQPDVIDYDGIQVTLTAIKPYNRFGGGFCKGIGLVQVASSAPREQ